MDDNCPPSHPSKNNSPLKKKNAINVFDVLSSSTKKNELILAITSNDILCGRGSGPNDHCGNVAFRQIVSTRRSEYLATSTRTEKARISNEILSVVWNLKPPGRFLEKAECSGRNKADSTNKPKWNIVSDHKALEKVKQALRQMRHRKSDSDALDYRSVSDVNTSDIGRCHHRRVQSAPGSILDIDLAIHQQHIEGGHHRRSNSHSIPRSHHPHYLNGNTNNNGSKDPFCAVFDEPHHMMAGLHGGGIYPSPHYHHSSNHVVYTAKMMRTSSTGSYTYNGASVQHSHTPHPPPPSMHIPSAPRSDMYANQIPNHHTNNNVFGTSYPPHYHQQREHEVKQVKNKKQEHTPVKSRPTIKTTTVASAPGVSSFDPEQARFICTLPSLFNGSASNANDNQDHSSTATVHCVSTCSSDALPLFESGGSSGLLPLAMEDLDDNDDDLIAAIMLDDKIPQGSVNKNNHRSQYLSISRNECSTRNLFLGDDFSLDDGTMIVDPKSFKYTRSKDHHDPNEHNINTFSNSSIAEYSIDEISANAGMTMMDMLESESSLPEHRDMLLFDFREEDRNPVDKFDRMVMAVTTPHEVWIK